METVVDEQDLDRDDHLPVAWETRDEKQQNIINF